MKGIGRTFSARNIRRFGLSLIAISFLCIFGLCMKSQANWQRGAFLNADFRSQSPTTGNIIYALFGDGTTGSTAYTRNWTGSCIPTSIQHLLSSFNGGPLNANTIYIINSGNYTLSSNITFNGNCIALVGSGDVIINGSNKSISVNTNDVIVDNIQLYSGSSTTAGFLINGSTNATFNNIQGYSSLNNGLIITGGASFINIDNSQFYNNQVQGISVINSTHATINNTLVYNNGNNGIEFITASENSLNNSQSFNNANVGVYIDTGSNIIHNSMIYNNAYGIFVENPWINYINNVSIYNNSIGIFALTGELDFFGTIKLFSNTNDTGGPGLFNTNPGSGPITSWSAAGSFDTTDPGLDYDRVTNPKNGSNSFLLSGGLTPPQGWQSFNATSRPIRYIFGLHILKQLIPVSYSQGGAVEYGNDLEDFDSSKYIAELDSVLPPAQQTIINQYFGSGSMYTQNRQNNGCSLSSFQVVNLPGNIMGFNSPIYLQDHTIYILTGGTDEYRFIRNSPTTSFFVFSGDCIAVVGNANTRITADAHNLVNMFYANNQRNLIIDSVKIDGKYYGNGGFNVTGTLAGINFDGTTNNSTINNTQVYNNKEYGIAFGIGSHDNTILNAQLFNNGIAGIYLYYSSNYNVINNTQTYNNSGYGIRFANGSIRNTMNNFQSYNNDIGLFGDMTTKENVINNALIYNNSTAGIYFKNSSGNILNHVGIYNNKVGIKTAYSSLNNTYYDTLTMFGNWSGDFNGTNGSDMYFAQGTNGGVPFTTPGLSGGGLSMSCVYTTNPTLVSGNNLTLLTGNCDATRVNSGFKNQNDMNVNYTFGLNIYKQVQPFRYDSGGNLLPILDQYDTSKYIAEVFPIRVTFPEGLDTWVSLSSTGNYQLNTGYTTNIYIVNGINTPVTGSLTLTPSSASGHLIINNTPVGMTGVINDGDSIQVWLLSSTGFDQTITGAVTIGTSGPRPLTLTTRDPSVSPTTGSFNFLNISGVQINTYTGSTVTVNGIETGVSASISFLPPLTSGWLEIYSGNNFLYSGTTGLVFNGNKVKVVVKSSAQYGDIITGTVFIGLGSGSFTVQTLPDIYAPIIAFIDDVTPGYWADSINIYFSGANALSGYIFVNAPALCNTGMSTTGIVPYTTGFTVTVPLYNGQYVCAYGRDLGNNISTLVSSSAFNVAGLYFADGVETGPVAYDLVDIRFPSTTNSGYALVSSPAQCTVGISLNHYTSSLLFTNTGSNGQYVCAYGEDAGGNGRLIVSANAINIDPSLPSLHFTDDVSSGAVYSDTIAVDFSGVVPFMTKLYKFVNSSSDCNATGATNYTGAITITNEGLNGKYFCAYGIDLSGHQLMLTSQYPLNIDRTHPTAPTATFPINNEELFFISFESTGAVDTGSGISGYNYEVADDHNFSDIINSGFVETTGETVVPEDFTEVDGDYYRRVQAIDNVGLASAWSSPGSFTAKDNPDFFFDEVTHANRTTYYDSEDFTVNGLDQNDTVWASVDNGVIYKNGHDKGARTPVQNDDVISIHLKSSSHYHSSVTSTLTIANRNTDFMITTITDGESCNLSDQDKGIIQTVFSGLVSQFSGDQNRYNTFLSTMESMLQDQIDFTNDCNLQYLSDLINGTTPSILTINTGDYIAPNCKDYHVSYDNVKLAYTSPDFRTPVFYATRESLGRFIDAKNPGDCHISANTVPVTWYFTNSDPTKHIALNGKVYGIQSNGNGYTSSDLSTVKYFTSLVALRSYLDKKNPPSQIWSHTVDTSFTPVAYTAPNGKEYTVYKTNRGYMSYRLLQVKYFTTLQTLETFISKNNAK